MSLLDEVRKLEQRVVDRLKELEPLTREYDQLRKLAERLGVKYSPRPGEAEAETKPSATRGRGGTRARAARTSAKGQTTGSRAAARGSKSRGTRSAATAAAGGASATGAGSAAASGRGTKRAGTRGQRSGARRRTAARPGQRHEEVLRLVAEQPGITVREIAGRLGVDSTGLYRVVKRLTDEERIRKDGTALYPSQPATDSGSAPQSAAAGGEEAAADGEAQTPTATASTETASPVTETSTASPRDT